MTALLKVPYVHYTGSPTSIAQVRKMLGPKTTVSQHVDDSLNFHESDSLQSLDVIAARGDYVLLFTAVEDGVELTRNIVVLDDCCFVTARDAATDAGEQQIVRLG